MMIPRNNFAALTLTLAFFHASAGAADLRAGDAACDFVTSYGDVVEQEIGSSGELRLVAAVSDFGLMGLCLSQGCDSIDGSIWAAGNDISFQCGGSDVVVTNLSVADAEARRDLASREPVTYAQWAAAFSATDLSDLDGDGDGDGLSNLLEYALGLDPTTAGGGNGAAQFGLQSIGGERFLTLSYHRDLARAGVAVEVQASHDLAEGWTTAGVEDELVGTSGGVEQHIAKISRGAGRQFLRLVVRQE